MTKKITKKKPNKALEKYHKKLQTIKTENGKLIYKLMKLRGIKGCYKDYVLITPTEIIDWQDKWFVMSGSAYRKPQLMHKKLLKYVLGTDAAAQIWHPIMRRLVGVKPGTNKMEVNNESR